MQIISAFLYQNCNITCKYANTIAPGYHHSRPITFDDNRLSHHRKMMITAITKHQFRPLCWAILKFYKTPAFCRLQLLNTLDTFKMGKYTGICRIQTCAGTPQLVTYPWACTSMDQSWPMFRSMYSHPTQSAGSDSQPDRQWFVQYDLKQHYHNTG